MIVFTPRLDSLTVVQLGTIDTCWSNGAQLRVDLTEKMAAAGLGRLLNEADFAKVQIAQWGDAIEWEDSEFGVDNLYAWGIEQAGETSHEQLLAWVNQRSMTLDLAAKTLGIDQAGLRDQLSAQKPVDARVAVQLTN